MTVATEEFWVTGTYEAVHRPAPRHRVTTIHIQEELPVSIRSLSADKAPVVLEYTVPTSTKDGTDTEHQIRLFEGSFWRPYTYYASKGPMSVADFRKHIISPWTQSSTPFFKGRAEHTRDKVPGQILSDKRNSFFDDMAAVAHDMIVIDDIMHQKVGEPILMVTLRHERHVVDLDITFGVERLGRDHSFFRIDQMAAALEAAAYLSEHDARCEIKNQVLAFHVDDNLPLNFDPVSVAVDKIADSGAAAFEWRNLRYLSNNALENLLALRKLCDDTSPVEQKKEIATAALEALKDALHSTDEDQARSIRYFWHNGLAFQTTMHALQQHELAEDLDVASLMP